MSDFFSNIPVSTYLIIGGLILLAIIWIIVWSVYSKNKKSKFLTIHPDAVKIYSQSAGKSMLSSIAAGDVITIRSIDGLTVDANTATGMDLSSVGSAIADRKRAAEVFARMGDHLLTTPGPHVLSLVASHSRPGITAKTVYTTYGPFDVQVTLAPSKSYQLSFDRDSQQFSITERPTA